MLTDEDRKYIEDLFKSYYDNELIEHQNHFWGMMKDVSDGNIGKSIEILRSIIKAHKRVGKFGMWIAYVFVSLAATGLFYTFWEGLKFYLSKIQK